MNPISYIRRSQNGQATVEFAIVVTMLIPFLMGVFDLGRAVYAYSVVSSAAREGARYAITDPTNSSAIEAQAKRNITALDPTQLTVNSNCLADCSVGTAVNVTVRYNFQPATLFFTHFDVTSQSTMTIE